MKFFINDAVLRNRCSKIKKKGYNKIELVIPNYLEYKEIKFIFYTMQAMKESDILLNNISINKSKENVYKIRKKNKKTEKCMYALIKSEEIIPDDVFVPVAEIAKKEKIKVLKRICFCDIEADVGYFFSNVYLIKIKLSAGENIPIYLAGKNSKSFSRYYIFSRKRNGEYMVSAKYNKHISAKECEMISLSYLS